MIMTADNFKKYTGDIAWSPVYNIQKEEFVSELVDIKINNSHEQKLFGSFPNCEKECDILNGKHLHSVVVVKKPRVQRHEAKYDF